MATSKKHYEFRANKIKFLWQWQNIPSRDPSEQNFFEDLPEIAAMNLGQLVLKIPKARELLRGLKSLSLYVWDQGHWKEFYLDSFTFESGDPNLPQHISLIHYHCDEENFKVLKGLIPSCLCY
jgi:hypothetical protein